jgi:hypothetical protein
MEEKSTSKFIWIIAAVLLVLAVGGLLYAMTRGDTTKDAASDMPAGTSSETNTPPTTGDEETKGTVIVFTDDGFDPLKYVSKEGEAVTVRNDSSMDLQFSSADHPTHLEHPEFNMEVLSPGESGTFTPESTGTFEFHDHLNSQFTGTLTVE